MHKKFDIPRASPESAGAEYYGALASLAEEQARNIRRIAGLERARLEERLLEQKLLVDAYAAERERLQETCRQLRERSERLKGELATAKAQLKAFGPLQDRISLSRAHQLAETYVRHASGTTLYARTLRLLVQPVAWIFTNSGPSSNEPHVPSASCEKVDPVFR